MQEYKLPYGTFNLQKQMLQSEQDELKLKYGTADKFRIFNPLKSFCGSDENYIQLKPEGKPTEFCPFELSKHREIKLGNDDFGVEFSANLRIEGKEFYSDIFSLCKSKISLLGNTISAVEVSAFNDTTKSGYSFIVKILNNEVLNKFFHYGKTYNYKFNQKETPWSFPINFSLGPFDVTGEFGVNLKTEFTFAGNADKQNLNTKLYSDIHATVFGNLKTGFKVASAGIGGDLELLNDELEIVGNLEFLKPEIGYPYFKASSFGKQKGHALKGKLYAFVEVDYVFGTKKFKLNFYHFDGYDLREVMYSVNVTKPALKDRKLWLFVNTIQGITPFSARNEKLNIESSDFEIFVDINGESYYKNITDKNHDGILDSTFLYWEIPLLSYRKIPVSISVYQKYKVGEVYLRSQLDISPDDSKTLNICYDPFTKKFTGSCSGNEDEKKIVRGNTNYFGERNHLLSFKLTPSLFKPVR